MAKGWHRTAVRGGERVGHTGGCTTGTYISLVGKLCLSKDGLAHVQALACKEHQLVQAQDPHSSEVCGRVTSLEPNIAPL